jgi:hypothetical protein
MRFQQQCADARCGFEDIARVRASLVGRFDFGLQTPLQGEGRNTADKQKWSHASTRFSATRAISQNPFVVVKKP